jgi:uncharacterized protein (DUF1501 family)
MSVGRRAFLTGAASFAAAGSAPKLVFAQNASQGGGFNDEVLVYVFLRGGLDGLSLYAPGSGHPDRGHYEGLRTSDSVRLPLLGANAMLPLADGFGLNSAAAPLHDLWTQGDLGFVHATGLPIVNRSHFEAERFIEFGTPGSVELGIPGSRLTPDGWLTRHLNSASNLPPSITLPAVVTESRTTLSFLRSSSVVSLRSPGNFDFNETTSGNLEEQVEDTLQSIYAQDGSDLGAAGELALTALTQVEQIFGDVNNFDYNESLSPADRYPTFVSNNGQTRLHTISDKLITLSRLIKADVGLRLSQVDYGGWDDHTDLGALPEGVNGSSGRYYDRLDVLSRAIQAFWNDMRGLANDPRDFTGRVTMVFQSEFGRRAFNNNDNGTDHGAGNMMMLLGGHVNGGQFHGIWPGLAPDDLQNNADLRTTTDFRQVLGEVMIRRFGNNQFGEIFPNFVNFEPMGTVDGPLIFPDYGTGNEIFTDSFE